MISGDVVGEAENFKYFFKYMWSFLQKDGDFGIDVKHRFKCGWIKWR
jgi:hypothetical protein